MYFTESSYAIDLEGKTATETFRFTLLVHPTKVEAPQLVLDGYECKVDDKLVGWYERNSPASLNRQSEEEVMEYDNYADAFFDATNTFSKCLSEQFRAVRAKNPKPFVRKYIILRTNNEDN